MHSPHFLRQLHLDPEISIVFAGDTGLKVLAATKFAIVDGIFDLVEEKLILTTLFRYHDSITVPCAYFLSNFKTELVYIQFFQVLYSFLLFVSAHLLTCIQRVNELTHRCMKPVGCLLDFEQALSNAWLKVFPDSNIMRDFFHLKQANTRKMRKFGLSDFCNEVINDIRVLWYADTKPEFDTRLNAFLEKWDEKAPQYSTYFKRQWAEKGKCPPSTWAAFARGKDAPSGIFFSFFCFV